MEYNGGAGKRKAIAYWNKVSKLKKVCIISIGLFILGQISIFLGLAKGVDIGLSLSRPYGATSWSVSNELIYACTYGLVSLGISLIIVSIVFITIVLINWLKSE
ncbi:hypothetical protein KQI38_03900 [Tissierella carlieri]|uniref:DUF4321 domain-containing protein n=1 Tax=Tissierella carlieri TaxID=689904 RepID=A0ABT1SDM6_9FIRM|nr:hypothetical protein [Tissierella carlieri]MBU5311159.1 hypothetical protein [Tissierella carlieri]MCQ4924524.1 hypothetical protein [Tissierella carlieri]